MYLRSRRLLSVALLSLAVALVPAVAPAIAGAPAQAPVIHPKISFHQWSTSPEFAKGTFTGAVARSGAITFCAATGSLAYDDQGFGYPTRTYKTATWTSPVYKPGFGLTELVASWNVDTPAGTWIQVEMMGKTNAAKATKWYVMGRWASGDGDIHRTSLGGQGDDDGTIAIDTFFSRAGVSLTAYQLRVTLFKLPGVYGGPMVRSVGAVASALPDDSHVPVSPQGVARGKELAVPRFSQDLHLGHYPEFNGGGEAWCSPTSTEMVVEYHGKHPADVSWVQPQPRSGSRR